MGLRATIRDNSFIEISFDWPRVVGDMATFSIYLDEELTEGVFTPVSYDGQEFECHCKRDLNSEVPDGQFTITPRGETGDDAGWLDFSMPASMTTSMGSGDFFMSARMWPSGDTDSKRTFITGVFPLRFYATR